MNPNLSGRRSPEGQQQLQNLYANSRTVAEVQRSRGSISDYRPLGFTPDLHFPLPYQRQISSPGICNTLLSPSDLLFHARHPLPPTMSLCPPSPAQLQYPLSLSFFLSSLSVGDHFPSFFFFLIPCTFAFESGLSSTFSRRQEQRSLEKSKELSYAYFFCSL